MLRAVIKRGFKGDGDGAMHSPMKQNKAHKSRAKPHVPAQPAQPVLEPVQRPVATAMALPIAAMHPYAPIVAVTPLPMQPLCFAPLL